MTPFVLDLQYFNESTVFPPTGETYEAGSFILFVAQFNTDTGERTLLSASNFVLDGDAYKSFQTFTINEVSYTLSFVYSLSTGFSCTFDYPYYLSIGASVFAFLGGGSSNNGGGSLDSLLTSINGHFGTFRDDVVVSVRGFEELFKIQSSFLAFDNPDTHSLIPTYRLISSDNKVLEAPHVLLSAKAS